MMSLISNLTEDFGADCGENFKRVVGCLKKAVQGMKESFDGDAPGNPHKYLCTIFN